MSGETEADAEERARRWCAKLFFLAFTDCTGSKRLLEAVRGDQYRLKLVCSLAKSLSYLMEKSADPSLDVYATELAEAFETRLQGERNMKEIEQLGAKGFFTSIEATLARCRKVTETDRRSSMETRLLLASLRSDSLPRKLQGLAMLKEAYQISSIVKESPYSVRKSCEKDIKVAIHMMKEVGIIKLLFSDSPHPELIRRSGEIVRLLVVAEAFTSEDVAALLDCYIR